MLYEVITPGGLRVWFDLAMIGAFGGLYSVPLYALIVITSYSIHYTKLYELASFLEIESEEVREAPKVSFT